MKTTGKAPDPQGEQSKLGFLIDKHCACTNSLTVPALPLQGPDLCPWAPFYPVILHFHLSCDAGLQLWPVMDPLDPQGPLNWLALGPASPPPQRCQRSGFLVEPSCSWLPCSLPGVKSCPTSPPGETLQALQGGAGPAACWGSPGRSLGLQVPSWIAEKHCWVGSL